MDLDAWPSAAWPWMKAKADHPPRSGKVPREWPPEGMTVTQAAYDLWQARKLRLPNIKPMQRAA
jgi:hypothetical protein